jgi:cyclic pyranopterin phosphate synthase
MLRYEDIIFTVQTFAELGLERIRVTGGEPLVRKNIAYLIDELTKISGIREITLTTNGTLLAPMAENLYAAGVRRVNISLDSLRSDRYKFITGGFEMEKTMAGIEAAKALGMSPIKINCVAIRGFNDDEILNFCDFAAEHGVTARFIEFMPIGNSIDWKKENIISGGEILERIAEYHTIEALPKAEHTGPARNYKLSNGATIGIITPMSNHFCGECDKIRLTADGKLRACLLSDKEADIAEAVRAKDKDALIKLLKTALHMKEDEHSVGMDSKDKFNRTMSGIGG